MSRARVVLACATRRGLACLERLAADHPQLAWEVVTAPEAEGEPRWVEDLGQAAARLGAGFRVEPRLERLPLWQPAPELLLLVHWRRLVPADVWGAPRRGSYAVHDSLLPAYRGFSPTVWAIANGEPRGGATLFRVGEAMDAGPIVAQEAVEIGPDATVADVVGALDGVYLRLLSRHLPGLLDGTAPHAPQDEAGASYTCRRLAEDNRIDWTAPARRVHDLVRAVTRPYPGAWTTLEGQRLRVWSTSRLEGWRRYVGAVPGRVVEVRPGQGAVVLAGDGPLLVREVEPASGGPCLADAVLTRLSDTLGR